jgi:lysophospholipase L1-like esterase
MMKKLQLILAFLFCCSTIDAQQPPPFYDDIQAFKAQDTDSMPPKDAILFVGSSSFTMWKDVQDYFPGHTIINRGFGGSTLQDVVRYANDVIIPYHAKQVVIYCGENDVAYSDETTAQMVLERFKVLFNIIRDDNPAVPVAFISLKPSPSRQQLWPVMKEANRLIKKYLAGKRKTAFIDVWPKMFNKDGTIMKDIFIEDNLHMNAKGYRIWQKLIEPYLIK